ncbi:EutN/CcmL family microcompartment protein [Limosilactobacillus ingluviei]|uniref:EutN/CcmL family microcompartment protein n=1 Tax=Limosilactobacillus ingluviei TaxID=148604 RepID=UPI0023F1C5BB|nr:EutN/CcmL family microcompartment protein [Limosilactobacillus ingluviei]
MYMAKVIGSVVSTQKDPSLVGKKLMIVQPINAQGESIRYEEVATDSVGAGIGEYVLIVKGSGARSADGRSGLEGNVNDCSIVGIIDRFDG